MPPSESIKVIKSEKKTPVKRESFKMSMTPVRTPRPNQGTMPLFWVDQTTESAKKHSKGYTNRVSDIVVSPRVSPKQVTNSGQSTTSPQGTGQSTNRRLQDGGVHPQVVQSERTTTQVMQFSHTNIWQPSVSQMTPSASPSVMVTHAGSFQFGPSQLSYRPFGSVPSPPSGTTAAAPAAQLAPIGTAPPTASLQADVPPAPATMSKTSKNKRRRVNRVRNNTPDTNQTAPQSSGQMGLTSGVPQPPQMFNFPQQGAPPAPTTYVYQHSVPCIPAYMRPPPQKCIILDCNHEGYRCPGCPNRFLYRWELKDHLSKNETHFPFPKESICFPFRNYAYPLYDIDE